MAPIQRGHIMQTEAAVRADGTLKTRFWAKVDKVDGGCWNWTGSAAGQFPSHRYGQIKVGGKRGKMVKAHRIIAIWRGDNIEGRVVMHTCDNTRCVNPDHLVVAEQIDNVRDMIAKGRRNVARGERNGRSSATDDQAIDIRRRLRDGATAKSVARELGLHYLAVYKIATRKTFSHIGAHIEYPHRTRSMARRALSGLTEELVAQMRLRYAQMNNCAVIAREFGVDERVAYRAITGRRWSGDCSGVAPVKASKFGMRGRRLMTDEQATACFKDIASNTLTRAQIAEKYGVSTATVDAMKAGRSYSWISGGEPPRE